ncbi:hypothetical protein BsWGS_21010 [Bradybaena similaris]
MSTIRKAYMEISNGIRGLRFHKDQASNSPSCPHDGGCSSKNPATEDGRPSSASSRTSKSVVHTEENIVANAVSRLFPAKSASPTLNRHEYPSTPETKFMSSQNSSAISSLLRKTPSPLATSSTQTNQSTTIITADQNSNHTKQQHDDSSLPNGKLKRPNKDAIFTPTKLVGQPKAGIACRIRKLNMSMTGQKWTVKPETIHELMMDEKFISQFFFYFPSEERRKMCQVCKKWKSVLYQSIYWAGVMPVIDFNEWRSDASKRRTCFEHFQQRGFDQVCLVGATDKDISDFVNNTPSCKKSIRSVSIRCSNISDCALENLIRKAQQINTLELSNCNEITGSGLWACLNPKIVSLTITDCIHIADDTLGAIAQLLPGLHELNLQAYHITDNGLALFDSKLNSSLRILRLKSCWEITNHGVVNIIHGLPNVTVLSLSGCSKITDDGVEIIAENMTKLKCLDISWCSRVTDASLEYVACDLSNLEELILDR